MRGKRVGESVSNIPSEVPEGRGEQCVRGRPSARKD